MSSVRLPRSARAAARLMAVVVLPTPPFWFAMATIIVMKTREGIVAGNSRIAELATLASWRVAMTKPPTRPLHFVFPQVVRVEALEPLVQPIGVGFLRGEIDGLGVIDDRLLDENRRPRPECQRDGVAWAGVDGQGGPVQRKVDEAVNRGGLQMP